MYMCVNVPPPTCPLPPLHPQEQAEKGGSHSSAAGGDLRESHQTRSLGSQEGDQSQNQSHEGGG